MFLPPPRSTLFPYTTLFRSLAREERYSASASARNSASGVASTRPSSNRSVVRRFATAFASGGIEDRKSTRLNSSHLGISYAVFCLKKKKKQHKRRDV